MIRPIQTNTDNEARIKLLFGAMRIKPKTINLIYLQNICCVNWETKAEKNPIIKPTLSW